MKTTPLLPSFLTTLTSDVSLSCITSLISSSTCFVSLFSRSLLSLILDPQIGLLGFHIEKKQLHLFIYLLIFSCAGSSLLFGTSWNFFGIFSIGGWLNLWMWNPRIQRADYILLLFSHCFFLQLQGAGATPVVLCGLLVAVTFLVAEHGLQAHGLLQLWLLGSREQAQLLWCMGLVAPQCEIFLDQGSNLCLPHWQEDSLQPGMPLCYLLYHLF